MSFKLEQLVIELKQSVETLKQTIETLNQTIETQQLRINHLSSVADLTFPIVSDIYKSHLIKGTSHLIFWSLSHHVGHYVSPETITLLDALVEVLISRGQGRGDAELKAIALNEVGLHTPAKIQILSDLASLRNTPIPWHVCTMSTIVKSRNDSAHKTTPKQLSQFISILDHKDAKFYAKLFKFVFQFHHTEIDQQCMDKQNQLLMNSGSYDTIFSFDPNEVMNETI